MLSLGNKWEQDGVHHLWNGTGSRHKAFSSTKHHTSLHAHTVWHATTTVSSSAVWWHQTSFSIAGDGRCPPGRGAVICELAAARTRKLSQGRATRASSEENSSGQLSPQWLRAGHALRSGLFFVHFLFIGWLHFPSVWTSPSRCFSAVADTEWELISFLWANTFI